MSVKHVFHGFFRSGTTLVWRMLRDANPGVTVFYEPFHPSLIEKIRRREEDNIHGIDLWAEYRQQDSGFRKSLAEAHGRLDSPFPTDAGAVRRYLDVFNQLDGPAILQTNRCHFHVDVILQYGDVDLCLLMRNPYDVHLSLTKVFWDNAKWWMVPLSYLKNWHTPVSNVFGVKEMLCEGAHQLEWPRRGGLKQSEVRKMCRNPLVAHLTTWLFCNWVVIQQHIRLRGTPPDILCYEDLTNGYSGFLEGIEGRLHFDLHTDIIEAREENGLERYLNPVIRDVFSDAGLTGGYQRLLDICGISASLANVESADPSGA